MSLEQPSPIIKPLENGCVEYQSFYADGGTAVFSKDLKYRYMLTRTWDSNISPLYWLLMNPSTADQDVLDPTLRRCRSFSVSFGYGGMVILNLFAFRATHPVVLGRVENPAGDPMNKKYIFSAMCQEIDIVFGWGVNGGHRAKNFYDGVRARRYTDFKAHVYYLGVTKDGHPRHPLYLKGCSALQRCE